MKIRFLLLLPLILAELTPVGLTQWTTNGFQRPADAERDYDSERLLKKLQAVRDATTKRINELGGPVKEPPTPQQELQRFASQIMHAEMLVRQKFPLNMIETNLAETSSPVEADSDITKIFNAAVDEVHSMRTEATTAAERRKKDANDKMTAFIDKALTASIAAKGSQEIDPLIAEAKGLQNELNPLSPSVDSSRFDRIRNLLEQWRRLLIAQESGRPGEVLQKLRELRDGFPNDFPKMDARFFRLRMDEVTTSLRKESEILLKQATEELPKIRTSKEAADLQRKLASEREMVQSAEFVVNDLRPLGNLLNRATETMRQWTEYIAAIEHENWEKALQQFDQITSSSDSSGLSAEQVKNERQSIGEHISGQAAAALDEWSKKLPAMQVVDQTISSRLSNFSRALAIAGPEAEPVRVRVEQARLAVPIWFELIQQELAGDWEGVVAQLQRLNRIKKIDKPLITAEAIETKRKQAEQMLGRKVTLLQTSVAFDPAAYAARIREVKTKADILNLENELKSYARTGERISPELEYLPGQLELLTTLMDQPSNMQLLSRHTSEGMSGSGNPQLREAMQTLRESIVRNSMTKVLKLPELNQEPLSSMSLTDALEKVANDYAAKGDWKKTYEIVQQMEPTTIGYGAENSAIAGIRNYLAGKNFEDAEQWPQAVHCYQTVLECIGSDRVPIKEAGNRLKALSKEHPEAFHGDTPPAKP